MLTKQLKDAWLAELRDPTNTKCKNQYFPGGVNCNSKVSFKDTKCFCALGALIKVQANLLLDYDNAQDLFPCLYGIAYVPQQIMILNDNDDKTLPEIADWIEKNVECVE